MPLSPLLSQSGWSCTQDTHLCVCMHVSACSPSLPAPSLAGILPLHVLSLGVGCLPTSGSFFQPSSVFVSVSLCSGRWSSGDLLRLSLSFQGISPKFLLILDMWAPLHVPGISALCPVALFQSSYFTTRDHMLIAAISLRVPAWDFGECRSPQSLATRRKSVPMDPPLEVMSLPPAAQSQKDPQPTGAWLRWEQRPCEPFWK